jgi:pimeloyl-ACP methyl ester carboxylesterase
MTAAMNRLVAQTNADGVILFGVSGGGALAVLIADRSDKVRGVVTVAANLDLTAWSAFHRPASKIDLAAWWARHKMPGPGDVLNPATDGRRHAAQHRSVFERHYAGGRDRVVPPATQIRGLRTLSEQVVISDFDHNCCWARLWPGILADVERAMAVGVAATN